MAKILLVEDDQSLREIYGIRLTAEGYQIVPAGDGEEALAMAVREKPDLIISDVMMPKISGFDMLDILRSTPETKNIKVIMMTALSSEDQRARGEALGADRFLVKSQVGIEDVVNAVHEVLDQNQNNNTENKQAVSQSQSAQQIPAVQNTQPTVSTNVQFNQPANQTINQTATQAQPTDQVSSIQQNQPMNQTMTNQQNQPTNQESLVQQDQSVAQVSPVQQNQSIENAQITSQNQTVQQEVTVQPDLLQTDSQSNSNINDKQPADSYTIDTVTDESGMNIKDQMDQILGGMGSV
mgnify:FL=1